MLTMFTRSAKIWFANSLDSTPRSEFPVYTCALERNGWPVFSYSDGYSCIRDTYKRTQNRFPSSYTRLTNSDLLRTFRQLRALSVSNLRAFGRHGCCYGTGLDHHSSSIYGNKREGSESNNMLHCWFSYMVAERATSIPVQQSYFEHCTLWWEELDKSIHQMAIHRMHACHWFVYKWEDMPWVPFPGHPMRSSVSTSVCCPSVLRGGNSLEPADGIWGSSLHLKHQKKVNISNVIFERTMKAMLITTFSCSNAFSFTNELSWIKWVQDIY